MTVPTVAGGVAGMGPRASWTYARVLASAEATRGIAKTNTARPAAEIDDFMDTSLASGRQMLDRRRCAVITATGDATPTPGKKRRHLIWSGDDSTISIESASKVTSMLDSAGRWK